MFPAFSSPSAPPLLQLPGPYRPLGRLVATLDRSQLPYEVDWRGTGADPGVKDQGMCGSCYVSTKGGAWWGSIGVPMGRGRSSGNQPKLVSKRSPPRGRKGVLKVRSHQYRCPLSASMFLTSICTIFPPSSWASIDISYVSRLQLLLVVLSPSLIRSRTVRWERRPFHLGAAGGVGFLVFVCALGTM